jgi:hypothetical protein
MHLTEVHLLCRQQHFEGLRGVGIEGNEEDIFMVGWLSQEMAFDYRKPLTGAYENGCSLSLAHYLLAEQVGSGCVIHHFSFYKFFRDLRIRAFCHNI